MNKTLLILIAIIFTSLLSIAQTVNKYKQDGTLIFQLKTSETPIKSVNKIVDLRDVSFLENMLSKYGIETVKQLHPKHKNELLVRSYQISFTNIQLINNFTMELNKLSKIEYAEAKAIYYSTEMPNDNQYGNTWDGAVLNRWPLDSAHASQAWDISHGNENVVIAVLDMGFDINSPDLVNNFVAGYDTGEDDNNVYPDGSTPSTHGNACAGIAAAETNNNIGISSMSYGCKVMPVKVVNENGVYSGAMDGIVWATDNGADVISMSFTGYVPDTYAQIICDYAWNNGTILIAAAGNGYGTHGAGYPAAYGNIVACAATDVEDKKADFSDYGNWVDISAPGTETGTTYNGSVYHNFGGTSSATPFVASLVALIKSYAVNATNTDILNCLYNSAKNIDALNPNYIGKIGAGRVNAYQAMLLANTFTDANTFANDAGITSITEPTGQKCFPEVSPVLTLRNYGTNNLQSATITYRIDAETAQTYNWTGNLAQNEEVIISLASITSTYNSHTFTATVSNPNGTTDQDASNNSISSNFDIISSDIQLVFNLHTDVKAYEISWEVIDALNNIVASGNGYSYTAGGLFLSDTICLNNGCYTFKIHDTRGDGLYNSEFNGDFNMTYLSGEEIFSMDADDGYFGTLETHNFCLHGTDAGISSVIQPQNSSCTSNLVPIVKLKNYGTALLTAVNINYQLYGGTVNTFNWTGSLAGGFVTEVTLPVLSSVVGAHTFSASTNLPNDITDENTVNDNNQSNVTTYSESLPLPFIEDFETNGFDNQMWVITNPDGERTWEIASISGNSPGNNAAKRRFYDENPGSEDRDAIITAPLNFSDLTEISLTFDYAYKKRYSGITNNDSLIIYVSSDCGQTYTRILALSDELITDDTQSSEFTPSTSSQWETYQIINLNAYAGQDNILVKFETFNTAPKSNNLFIDNIRIGETVYPDIPNNAMFISQTVPTLVTPNQVFDVTLTYKNIGTSTWTNSSLHYLGTQNTQDNITWGETAVGLGRVGVTTDVAQTEEVTFTITLTAPSTVGNYNFQRQMLQHTVEWFGEISPNIVIRVDTVNAASFVSQTVPITVTVGEEFMVSLTYQNTGNKTWSSSILHSLGSQNTTDNNTWGVGSSRIALPNDVAPGEQVTFEAIMTAPSTAGDYNFQRQMLQDGAEWFGDLSDNVSITVELTTNVSSIDNAEIVIIPNPVKASNSITIKGDFNNNEKIILLNINGQKIFEKDINGTNPNINLSEYNLNKAVYFIKIYNSEIMISKKLIILD